MNILRLLALIIFCDVVVLAVGQVLRSAWQSKRRKPISVGFSSTAHYFTAPVDLDNVVIKDNDWAESASP